jgi:hypothetical protein
MISSTLTNNCDVSVAAFNIFREGFEEPIFGVLESDLDVMVRIPFSSPYANDNPKNKTQFFPVQIAIF